MDIENPWSCSKLMTPMHDSVVANLPKENCRVDMESYFNSEPLHKYAFKRNYQLKRLKKAEAKKQGEAIPALDIKQERKEKVYESAVEWPKNLAGERCVINIDTSDKKDCVMVHLVVGELYKQHKAKVDAARNTNTKVGKWHTRNAEYYRNQNRKKRIIQFPAGLNSPIAKESFSSI